jgi:curved DNA-binding protein CbpA
MANFRTHYDNLKVTRTAPASVIKAAYKALCQTYHPDKFQGINEDAERIMKLVNTSYTVLIDPVQRALHDEWIKNKEAEATKEQHQKQDKQQSYSSKNESERKRKMWEEWKGPGQSNDQPQNEGRKPPPPPESKSSKNLEPAYYFWRRYFARYLIDYSLCGFLSLFAIAYWVDYGHQIPNWLVLNNYLYWIYISAPLWLVLEPITLSIFGTTPGKALFRLRLVSNNIEPNYWKRSFYVYVVGIGLGLPVISGLTMLYAGSRLKKNGKTDWDKWAGFNIEADPLSLLRKTVIIITLMIMGILVTTTCNDILPVILNPIITQVKENNSHELDDLLQKHATNQDTLNNANSLYDQKRYADALPLFQDLAVQGYSSAQNNLGVLYENGQGIARDYTQAAYWYRKAAEQGDVDAIKNLKQLNNREFTKSPSKPNKYNGDRLSLNLKDIEVRSALAIIAEFTGVSIVSSDNIVGKISLTVEDMPWDQALEMIIESQGLVKRETSNTLYIMTSAESDQILNLPPGKHKLPKKQGVTIETSPEGLDTIEFPGGYIKGNSKKIGKQMSESRLSTGDYYGSRR